MRIVFMGTPEFAIPSLRILVENKYDVVAVVTVPDKPAGRGLEVSQSAVGKYAISAGLSLLQPEDLRDSGFADSLSGLKPDLFVVVAFRILPEEVFTIPSRGAVNLHASLLPKYRGAAPINWAIINGERETGVTTFFLRTKVDTGNIILQARTRIGDDETAGELHDRLASIGAEIVLHTVRLIESGKAAGLVQDDALATMAPKIHKDQCKIDWTKSVRGVHNFVRGLSPRPGAFTYHKETMMKIYRTKPVSDTQPTVPGEIRRHDDRLVVSTSDGTIEVTEIQQAGKRKMTAQEFLRGYPLTTGERFQ